MYIYIYIYKQGKQLVQLGNRNALRRSNAHTSGMQQSLGALPYTKQAKTSKQKQAKTSKQTKTNKQTQTNKQKQANKRQASKQNKHCQLLD